MGICPQCENFVSGCAALSSGLQAGAQGKRKGMVSTPPPTELGRRKDMSPGLGAPDWAQDRGREWGENREECGDTSGAWGPA